MNRELQIINVQIQQPLHPAAQLTPKAQTQRRDMTMSSAGRCKQPRAY